MRSVVLTSAVPPYMLKTDDNPDGPLTEELAGSGARTHAAIPHSELVVIEGGPHGVSVSHPREFNEALLAFLAR